MNELTQVKDSPATGVDGIIAKALEHNVTVETLERLMTMRDKLLADKARADYFAALSAFQAECPIVRKTRAVKGKSGGKMYSYASLDDIVEAVKPILQQHGLSYTIKTATTDPNFITAITEVHHIGGHSEESSFSVPIDRDSFMNDAQKSGSALTYAKRYSFCNAFGILTGDTDDDAASLGSGTNLQAVYAGFSRLMSAVLEHHETVAAIKEGIANNALSSASEAWAELTNEQKQSLWVAPTKGGPFTTKERDIMRSEAFYDAHFGPGAWAKMTKKETPVESTE